MSTQLQQYRYATGRCLSICIEWRMSVCYSGETIIVVSLSWFERRHIRWDVAATASSVPNTREKIKSQACRFKVDPGIMKILATHVSTPISRFNPDVSFQAFHAFENSRASWSMAWHETFLQNGKTNRYARTLRSSHFIHADLCSKDTNCEVNR